MTGKSDKEKNTEDKPKSKADSQREKVGGKTYSEPLETNDKDFYEKNSNNKKVNILSIYQKIYYFE